MSSANTLFSCSEHAFESCWILHSIWVFSFQGFRGESIAERSCASELRNTAGFHNKWAVEVGAGLWSVRVHLVSSRVVHTGTWAGTVTFKCQPFCSCAAWYYELPETPMDRRVPAGTKLPHVTSHGKTRLGKNNMEFLPDGDLQASLANFHWNPSRLVWHRTEQNLSAEVLNGAENSSGCPQLY